MAHVFISYSSKHLALTQRLKSFLVGKGLAVWHDLTSLEARGPFDGQILAGLQKAEAVVVIWTTDAIVSPWVHLEADYAAKHNKLVNVEPAGIDRAQLPERFRNHHRHVQSDLRPLDMERVLHDIIAVRAGRPLPAEVPLRQHYEDIYDELILATKKAPLPDGLSEAPSLLLQAKYGIVDFIDLQGLRPRLVDWAEGNGEGARTRQAAGRLVHGPGGLGKTRLMIEVAAALRERGWSAGFLNRIEASERHPDKPKLHAEALAQLIDSGTDSGLAIVIDYAEARTDEVKALARQLRSAAEKRPGRPLVLFLLTREIGEWWDNLRRDDTPTAAMFAAGLGRTAEIAIKEDTSVEARRTLFDAARAAFGNALTGGITANTAVPSPAVLARLASNADYDRPLAVLMEALLHVYAQALSGDEIGIAALLDGILDLEVAHWRKVIPSLADTRELQRATAQLTLVGGTSARSQTASLLMTDPSYAALRTAPAATDSTASALAQFYGNGRGGLSGLEPDLVGEHMVLTEAARDLTLAQRLVDACLAWDDGDKTRWRTLLTVLNRATKPEHGSKAALALKILADIVQRYALDLAPVLVDVAVAEPEGCLGQVIEEVAPTLEVSVLHILEASLPDASEVLTEAALVVTATLVSAARKAGTLPSTFESRGLIDTEIAKAAELARCLSNFGNRLSALGLHKEALAAGEEAVDLCRKLAAARPDLFTPDLATYLGNLSNRLSDLGRSEHALAASEEAVGLYRTLAAINVNAFLPRLASVLGSFANRLSALGRRKDGLAASEEAVALCRTLAASSPGTFAPDLASSLGNLGAKLWQLGRTEEALSATEEAASLYRTLAATKPDAYISAHAGHLGNLGVLLWQLGHHQTALAATREAIGHYRALAAANPGGYLPDLARILGNLGALLLDSGQLEAALDASEEAANTYRELAAANPDAFTPDLAGYLGNFGLMLSNVGRHEAALKATEETVNLYRTLAATNPDAFLPGLAKFVGNLGLLLPNLGRHEEALSASEEAVRLYRSLAVDTPDAFTPDLARNLSVTSDVLASLGRPAEALTAAENALSLLLPFAQRLPDAHGGLARTILNDVMIYSALARTVPDADLLERARATLINRR